MSNIRYTTEKPKGHNSLNSSEKKLAEPDFKTLLFPYLCAISLSPVTPDNLSK